MSSLDSGPPRAQRALFLLVVLLVTLGSCGAAGGALAVRLDSIPPPATTHAEGSDEEAFEMASRRVVEAWLSAKLRKPLAAANVIVSVLLLVAASALVRRRATGVWWTTQAALANVALAIAETTTSALALRDAWGEIVAMTPERPDQGLAAATESAQVLGMVLLVRIAMYGWIVWRVRRPDVRALLSAAR